jgi:tetratricopeptide (TPR) repeat protein
VTADEAAAHAQANAQAHAERLHKEGNLEAAAEAWLDAGQPLRAASLFEQLFLPQRAVEAFSTAGKPVDAVRVAVAAALPSLNDLCASAVQQGHTEALRALLHRTGSWEALARLDMSRGDVSAAVDGFAKAQRFDLAAGAAEQLGAHRRAGQMWEQHLEAHADDAHAHVHMGRMLARFGEHEAAIASLQAGLRLETSSSSLESLWALAGPVMALSFVRLGHPQAAEHVLAEWRACTKTPADVPTMEALGQSGHALQGDIEAQGQMLLRGRYLLGEPLGGGGVGQVFRAHDVFCDEPVAVKILGADALRSEAVRAFTRDARAASLMELPSVARMIELNLELGFVVTELLGVGGRGRRLDEWLQHEGSGVVFVALMRDLLRSLAACHRASLVHGGLKMSNLFVLERSLRMVDFGAHHLMALRSTETGGSSTIWPSLSPELLRGEPMSVQGDLYAVATLLWWAWSGTHPYASEHARRDVVPAAVQAETDEVWRSFFLRALNPDAAHRFRDAQAMADAVPAWPPTRSIAASSTAHATSPKVASSSWGHERYRADERVPLTTLASAELWTGQDMAVGRPIWIVRSDDAGTLAPLVRCARQWHALQPVYDVVMREPETWVVLARDTRTQRVDLSTLRVVPQGLARDLLALAKLLEGLHADQTAFGGFTLERALGPVGIRMTLAPAALPVEASVAHIAGDWRSFGLLARAAFGADDVIEDDRAAVGEALLAQQVLDHATVSSLVSMPWVDMLRALAQALVVNAEARVVSRMVANAIAAVATEVITDGSSEVT